VSIKAGQVNRKQLPMARWILPTIKTHITQMSLLATSQVPLNGTAVGFTQGCCL